jgi:integrase
MRGIFERPKGSGVWWVSYFGADGKRHREKVGRKSDAKALYQKRKTDVRAGAKLPVLRGTKGVTVGDLIDDALVFVKDHKDYKGYVSKAAIVRAVFGEQVAENFKPTEIKSWLDERFNTPATKNRYKAFLSLCYREGIESEKVSVNPAKLVRRKKEPAGRARFLSREHEYPLLCKIITKRFPEHLDEFIVSVHTGMRLGEQYGCTWRQVHFDRKTIELKDTKNGEDRTVHLNSTALEILKRRFAKRPKNAKPTDLVFPRPRKGQAGASNRSWFDLCTEEAGITDYLWHGNRHTFGSWLAMAGASSKEIQEAGGWKTIQMAARYSHLSPSHKGSVVERITMQEQVAPKVAPRVRKVS